jgi:hypothetical protein
MPLRRHPTYQPPIITSSNKHNIQHHLPRISCHRPNNIILPNLSISNATQDTRVDEVEEEDADTEADAEAEAAAAQIITTPSNPLPTVGHMAAKAMAVPNVATQHQIINGEQQPIT